MSPYCSAHMALQGSLRQKYPPSFAALDKPPAPAATGPEGWARCRRRWAEALLDLGGPTHGEGSVRVEAQEPVRRWVSGPLDGPKLLAIEDPTMSQRIGQRHTPVVPPQRRALHCRLIPPSACMQDTRGTTACLPALLGRRRIARRELDRTTRSVVSHGP